MPSLPGRPASQRDSITWHPGQANHQGGLSGRNHDCGYNCADQCLVLPGVPPGMETPRCAEYAEYDGWMSQFCLQPLADPRNGALAFFFPCVLYGKTKWRIEKLKAEFEREQGPPGSRGVVEGRQPGEAHAWEDSMFKCEDGCNDNCLSCFLSCLCTCGVCYWDQPCVLRQQVRGLYAISGGPWGDIGVSICCVCFSLAQLDKEIRAREGQDDLRTSRPFCRHKSHVELETRQPKLTQPMLYRPTMSFRPPIRRTSTYFAVGYPGRSRSDPTNLRSNDALLEPLTSEMQAPKKLTKKNKQDGVGQIYDFVSAGSTSNISPRDCAVAAPRDPVETFEPYHGALNKGLDFLVGRASRMRSESNAADKGIAEQISQRGLEKCGKREKPGDVESHSLTECDPMTNVLTETVEQNSECDTVVITSPGVEDEHSLMSCDPIAATPSESNGQHALKECTTTPIGFSIAAEQHELPECAIVAITPPTASEQYTFFNCKGEESTSPVAVDQHYLQECSKIPVTSPPAIKELVLTDYEDSSNGSEIQHPQPKLRYVHSRRDCSVDRNLLEYYEKEERKARQYTFGDCPRTFSVDSRFNNRSLQHPLTDCDINGNQIIRSTSTANTVPESYDSNEVGYAYDVSYLTQSLHDTQSSDVSVFAKSKSNGSESEPKPVIDSYFYDKSYLTDIRHSTEGIATLGSDENVTSSENDYRRRRLKRKADTSEVQEERKTIQGSATIDNGSSCATPSDAQVLLARILAAQKERNAKSRTWSRRRRLVDGCDEMPDSGEWFGQKLYVGKTRMRSCSSPFAF